MPLPSLAGLDHLVLAVPDLSAAAETWRELGFTLSPAGRHSPHLGTGNHTVMFEDDYLELLGVLAPTEHNAPTRAFLERRGAGLERIALTALDAAVAAAALRERGIAATGPVDFGRPVPLPEGGEAIARFRTIFWPDDRAPAGLRLFACQHLTREVVWLPALVRHANTARRIVRVEVLVPDPAAAAQVAASALDAPVRSEAGRSTVATGPGRADIAFLDRAALAARYPGVPLDGLAHVVVLEVGDLDAAARALPPTAARSSDRLVARANGVLLAFQGRSDPEP